MADRSVLSTWEAGRYCNVSPYTIRNWVERGILAAYTTPGGHRRIRREDLDAFLEQHHMPSPRDFETGDRRILLLEGEPRSRRNTARLLRAAVDGISVQAPDDPFTAGTLLHAFAPQLVIFDLDDRRVDWRAAVVTLGRTPGLGRTRTAGLSATTTVVLVEEAQRRGLLEVLTKPVTAESVRELMRLTFPYLRLPASVKPRRAKTAP